MLVTHSSDMAALPTVFGMSFISLRKYKPRRKEQLLKAGTLIKVNDSLTVLFYFLKPKIFYNIKLFLLMKQSHMKSFLLAGNMEYDMKLWH